MPGCSSRELVRIEIDARLGAAEPDPEIQELLAASVGENLGVDFLPGLAALHGGRRLATRSPTSPPRWCGSTR